MRDVGDILEDKFENGGAAVALLADFEFSSGTVRMWTGVGDITYNGETYLGGGNLVAISPYQETQEMQAQGLKFSLSGISSTLISLALGEEYQGRLCRLYIAVINKGSGALLNEDGSYILTEAGDKILLESGVLQAYRFFTGIMDTMDIDDDGQTSSIIVSAENVLSLLKRSKESRYTMEEQRSRYPDDAGLDFISQLQDKELVW